MCSLINKQLLLTAYAYLFIMEQQKAQGGSEALQVDSAEANKKADMEVQKQIREAVQMALQVAPERRDNALKNVCKQFKLNSSSVNDEANKKLWDFYAEIVAWKDEATRQWLNTSKPADRAKLQYRKGDGTPVEGLLVKLEKSEDRHYVSERGPQRYDDYPDRMIHDCNGARYLVHCADGGLRAFDLKRVVTDITKVGELVTTLKIMSGGTELQLNANPQQQQQQQEAADKNTQQQQQPPASNNCASNNFGGAMYPGAPPQVGNFAQQMSGGAMQPGQNSIKEAQSQANQTMQNQANNAAGQQQQQQQASAKRTKSFTVLSYNLDMEQAVQDTTIGEIFPSLATQNWARTNRLKYQLQVVDETQPELVFFQEVALDVLTELREWLRNSAYAESSLKMVRDLAASQWTICVRTLWQLSDRSFPGNLEQSRSYARGKLDEVVVHFKKSCEPSLNVLDTIGSIIDTIDVSVVEKAFQKVPDSDRTSLEKFVWGVFSVVNRLVAAANETNRSRMAPIARVNEAYTVVSFAKENGAEVFECTPEHFSKNKDSGTAQDRGVIMCRRQTGGQELVIAGTHLESLKDESLRDWQVNHIKSLVPAAQQLIIMGDLNDDGSARFHFDAMVEYDMGEVGDLMAHLKQRGPASIQSEEHPEGDALLLQDLSLWRAQNWSAPPRRENFQAPGEHDAATRSWWKEHCPSYVTTHYRWLDWNHPGNVDGCVRMSMRIQARVVDIFHRVTGKTLDQEMEGIKNVIEKKGTHQCAADRWSKQLGMSAVVPRNGPSYDGANVRKTKRREHRDLDWVLTTDKNLVPSENVETFGFGRRTKWYEYVRALWSKAGKQPLQNLDTVLGGRSIEPSDHKPLIVKIDVPV